MFTLCCEFVSFHQVDEYGIQQCTESMIRYYAKYYASSKHIFPTIRKNHVRKRDSFDKQHLTTVLEETPNAMQNQQHLNISELIEKLNKANLKIYHLNYNHNDEINQLTHITAC